MEEKIIQVLAKVKDENLVGKATGSTRIIDEIGLDSLEMINLMLQIEEKFGVEINFEEFELSYLETIASFSGYLSKLKKVSYIC
jgi:acyl carrier protein